MLPDYPKLKSDISARLTQFIRERVNYHLGALSEISHIHHFEGRSSRIVQPTGEEESTKMQEISETLETKADELPSMTLDMILMKFDEMARSMAEKMSKTLYDTISDATKKAGTSVDRKGAKISAESILQVLEKMHIDFDTKGNPRLPQIHIHPKLKEATQLALEELEKNPELKKAHKDLLDIKKEEWRAREASRRLVG